MVQSVSRALTILKTVANHPNGIGVTDLARVLNVHKSTVSRLIATLESEDAIERDPNSNGFRIGEGILSLAPERDAHGRIVSQLKPIVERLARKTGETVGISVPDQNASLTIFQIQSAHAIQVRDWTGERFPLHVSSSGKHFLARFNETRLREYMSRPLASYTKATITDSGALRLRLREVHRQSIDWTYGEFEDGLVAVSVPVINVKGEAVASLYIGGPRFRFPNGNKNKLTRLLQEAGRHATRIVSFQ
ncbi:MAG: IclR family transcriptional regulator [Candidatus Promineifilaceae bacterium]